MLRHFVTRTLPVLGLVTASASAVQAGTPQQDFDAASQAAAAGECTKAVAGFEALEKSGRIKAGSLVASVIGVRKGQCLQLIGRVGEGDTAILAGLSGLAKAGPQFADDVAEGYFALGESALTRWAYADAKGWFEKSLATRAGADRLLPLARLAAATAFDPGPQPLIYVEEALGILSSQPKSNDSKSNNTQEAALRTLRARMLLNRGRRRKPMTSSSKS